MATDINALLQQLAAYNAANGTTGIPNGARVPTGTFGGQPTLPQGAVRGDNAVPPTATVSGSLAAGTPQANSLPGGATTAGANPFGSTSKGAGK